MSRINKTITDLLNTQELKTKEDILAWFNQRYIQVEEVLKRDSVPKHLQGLEAGDALLRVAGPQYLYSIMNIAYYNSCLEDNPEEFLDGLFTYARLNHERTRLILSPDESHSSLFVQIVDLLAANDFDKALAILPLSSGLPDKGHRFAVAITGLIMVMLHRSEKLTDKALQNAEEYLKKKNPAFDNHTIKFLIAVIKQDYDGAFSLLEKLCAEYKKSKFLHDFKNLFLKEIAVFLTGLYKLACLYLEKDCNKLPLPNNSLLWIEFAELSRQGRPYITFEGPLEALNRYFY